MQILKHKFCLCSMQTWRSVQECRHDTFLVSVINKNNRDWIACLLAKECMDTQPQFGCVLFLGVPVIRGTYGKKVSRWSAAKVLFFNFMGSPVKKKNSTFYCWIWLWAWRITLALASFNLQTFFLITGNETLKITLKAIIGEIYCKTPSSPSFHFLSLSLSNGFNKLFKLC